jgi:hypothetical protein
MGEGSAGYILWLQHVLDVSQLLPSPLRSLSASLVLGLHIFQSRLGCVRIPAMTRSSMRLAPWRLLDQRAIGPRLVLREVQLSQLFDYFFSDIHRIALSCLTKALKSSVGGKIYENMLYFLYAHLILLQTNMKHAQAMRREEKYTPYYTHPLVS